MADLSSTPHPHSIPARRMAEVFTVQGRDISVDIDRVDTKTVSDERLAAEASSVKWNERAALEAKLCSKVVKQIDCAVYVIRPTGDPRVCKIGHSRNPLKRVLEVQNGSHQRLQVSHLFWLPKEAAKGLERFSLRVMGKLGKRLVGEWVGLTPDAAAQVVSVVALEANLPIATSRMFCRNTRHIVARSGIEGDSFSYNSTPEEYLSAMGY